MIISSSILFREKKTQFTSLRSTHNQQSVCTERNRNFEQMSLIEKIQLKNSFILKIFIEIIIHLFLVINISKKFSFNKGTKINYGSADL